jgi:hypothetical protein
MWLASRGIEEAVAWLSTHAESWGASGDVFFPASLPRHHPLLVECVETLGAASGDHYSCLKIATLCGRKYRIEEYDGLESVVEPDDVKWTDVPEDQ